MMRKTNHLVKGIVTDLDVGNVMASVQIKSGRRVISVVIPAGEVAIVGIELNREIYAMIDGKDITLIRDIKEFMTQKHKADPGLETYLVK